MVYRTVRNAFGVCDRAAYTVHRSISVSLRGRCAIARFFSLAYKLEIEFFELIGLLFWARGDFRKSDLFFFLVSVCRSWHQVVERFAREIACSME